MKNSVRTYDVIVVGGSIAGCFTAQSAANLGLKVLLIEARTYLGREVTSTLRPWISCLGREDADQELMELLASEASFDSVAAEGEFPLSLGRMKKRLLSKLRSAGVQVLFMSGPAGILTSAGGVRGIVIASKSGLQAVLAKTVVDATENCAVARLNGESDFTPRRLTVKRTIEFRAVSASVCDAISLPEYVGAADNRLVLHRGSLGEGHCFAEFALEVDAVEGDHAEKMQWELEARRVTVRICEYLKQHETCFRDAVLLRTSSELWHFSDDINRITDRNLIVLNTDTQWFENQSFLTLGKLRQQARRTAEQAFARISSQTWSVNEDELRVRMGPLEVPFNELLPTPCQDVWSGISYYSMKLKHSSSLPSLGDCDILVAGGGTSGAPAAIGAAAEGVRVTLIEGGSALGGTGTVGGINVYWFGYKAGFTAELDSKTTAMTKRISGHSSEKIWNIEAKMMTYLEEIEGNHGAVLFRTIAVDVLQEDRTIQGLVVLTPDGLGLIHADMVIDATGDGDVAAFAGVPYHTGDERGGNLQTFNLCAWNAKSSLAGVNLDLGVIDISSVFDVTRGIVIGHDHGSDYDFSAYPSVRESRHMECEYTLTVEDLLTQRTFPDVIAIGHTDFDQHGLQSSEFAKLGYLPYHQDCKELRFPLRACIPKGFDNLLITGKAFSAQRDAFSFMRMQSDLQNMGYAIGTAASIALNQGKSPGGMDLGPLQSFLLRKGILRQEDIEPTGQNRSVESYIAAADDANEFLQLICMPKETVLPMLRKCYSEPEYRGVRLPIAMAMAWFGADDGIDEMLAGLERIKHTEQQDKIDRHGRPVGGFIDQPNPYWQVNQLITLLGRAGDDKALTALCAIVNDTDAGGPPREHARLHWRRIPNYDRIICLCHSMEQLAAGRKTPAVREAAEVLETMMKKPHLSGYTAKNRADGAGNYASAYLELVIARTMAKCGSAIGVRILIEYLDDVQAVLSNHAHSELMSVTGKRLGKCSEEWRALFDAGFRTDMKQ
ncbi:FAD-dependent oxidoreductase [Paenibacillus solanacearum]|uniref:FAD-dependent oxidoreductase n=1 Tax=Paenibacillus solanacearum TaxID=2048548 RepID=UPI001C4028FB|nr:FAD-dependent oxidoreductase [Paenibacillus solanacearum]